MIEPTLLATLVLAASGAAAAETPGTLMARYAQEAGIAVTALSAERGAAFFRAERPGRDGKPASCAACHTRDPREAGRTRVGKRIEPLAPAANAQRFSDAAKVEKWFRRNCSDVLQRECTAQEKGDFVAWMKQVK